MMPRAARQHAILDALIRVYAPPRRARILFWDLPESFSETPAQIVATGPASSAEAPEVEPCTNACNSRSSLCRQSHEDDPAQFAPSTAVSGRRESRRESKRLKRQRWTGSVVDALSDIFTAIWANFVEPSDEFRTATQLQPGSRKPGSDAKLVSHVFSSARLMVAKETFRIHFRLMQEFKHQSSLPDWENNAAVDAYVNHMKADPMIRECCLGLFKRLGTPGLETVDAFVGTLRQVWFQPVSSSNADQPRCGYYHVCIGEFRNRSMNLSGMHNWFKYLVEEEKHCTKILNWWSYEKNLHLISMRFKMKHPELNAWFEKYKSSFLVGVPTDFELLLFTVVAMVNPNRDTSVQIKDYEPLVVVPRTLKQTGGLVTAYFRESPKQIGN